MIVRESSVPVDGGRLHVRETGSGQPVVLVHGGPDFDDEYLHPEMGRLGDRFRVITYAQRGRGRSFDGSDPGRVTMASEVEDLDRVRSSAGLASTAVVGHSWGGLLALEYALAHPDRVSHLVQMNTAPVSHEDAKAFRLELGRQRTGEQIRRMAELRASPAFRAGDIATDAEYYRLHFATTVRDPALLDIVVRRLRATFSPQGVVAARVIEEQLYADTWSRPDYDLVPLLGDLDVPVLVLHGDDDFVPLAVVRRIVDAIPHARLAVLPGGHFTYIEQPDRVLDEIADFLTLGRPAREPYPS